MLTDILLFFLGVLLIPVFLTLIITAPAVVYFTGCTIYYSFRAIKDFCHGFYIGLKTKRKTE